MPGARLTMRKIREVLRLKFDLKQSNRNIANSCRVSSSTVVEILFRFQKNALTWPLPEGLTDEELEKKLYPVPLNPKDRPVPDWEQVHLELKKKHVTLMLLWQEYTRNNPFHYGYTWFCCFYDRWREKIDVTMRQNYLFGEKCFVDYAGDTISIYDMVTGEVHQAQIFIGVLGASNYTYAEATVSQNLPCWIGSHVRMLNYFGGCPSLLIPDNLKSGVTKACHYEPDINRTYLELAKHYGCAVLPARAYTPRDKAKVEGGVLIVERWILAALRNRTFYSLGELNQAIKELLVDLNNRSFQKLPYTRRQLFEEKEKPTLKSLPAIPFELGSWKITKIGIDYHVEVEKHYYSAPYKYAREKVDIRISSSTIEVFHKGIRIASHKKSYVMGNSTTVPEHMPSHHRAKAEWTPERIKRWASTMGESVEKMVDGIMSRRPHPELGFKACFGLLRLGKAYGNERLEAACRRACISGAFSYKSVKSILNTGLDKQPLPSNLATLPQIGAGYHENVRGADYYSKMEVGI